MNRFLLSFLFLLPLTVVLSLASVANAKPISKPTAVTLKVTEYYSIPERWFGGSLINTAAGKFSRDFLLSARGVSMEGDGVARNGKHIHICDGFGTGWVRENGNPTTASKGFPEGSPAWLRGGYWISIDHKKKRHVTFPLSHGGWSNGHGRKYYPLPSRVKFCKGSSRPLTEYRLLAVDPRLIAFGSKVYLPPYKHSKYSGWFVAGDTGGAIKGRHVDAYVPAPAKPFGSVNSFNGIKACIIPPKSHATRCPKPRTVSSSAQNISTGAKNFS